MVSPAGAASSASSSSSSPAGNTEWGQQRSPPTQSLLEVLLKKRRSTKSGSDSNTVLDHENSSSSSSSRSRSSEKVSDEYDTDATISREDLQVYISTTRSWVQNWVVSNNLCPWAAATLQGNKLRVAVITDINGNEYTYNDYDYHNDIISHNCSDGQDEKIIMAKKSRKLEMTRKAVLKEIKLLCDMAIGGRRNHDDKNNVHSTTLICIPEYIIFEEYLELIALIEESLISTGMNKLIQIATFHPDYQFEDCDDNNDITNFTNRSPYPLIHLLMVSEVKEAIEQYSGNTKDIYERNKELMRKLTMESIESTFREFMNNTL